MGPLTDSLALYSLFAKLDPAASVGVLTGILDLSSSTPLNSLETAQAALGKLFGINYPSGQASREVLYTNLYALQNSAAFQQSSGLVRLSLLGASVNAAISGAQTDIAYRYALKELNPFVITGDNGFYGAARTGGCLADSELKEAA